MDEHRLVPTDTKSETAVSVGHTNLFSTEDSREIAKAASFHIYFNLFVKIAIALIELFLVVVVLRSLSADIDREVQNNMKLEESERIMCRKEYDDNLCDRENIPPALRGSCEAWKICAQTPPSGIGKSKAAARFFAQLVNEAVNPLSPKSIVTAVIIVGLYMVFPRF